MSHLWWINIYKVNFKRIKNVVLKDEAMVSIIEECKRHKNVETGGVLLGYEDGRDFIICIATDPGPNAIRKKNEFSFDAPYCNKLIDNYFINSNGKINYIGDWHRHFRLNLKPSQKDINAMADLATDRNCNIPRPILLIVDLIRDRLKYLAFEFVNIGE